MKEKLYERLKIFNISEVTIEIENKLPYNTCLITIRFYFKNKFYALGKMYDFFISDFNNDFINYLCNCVYDLLLKEADKCL